MLPNSKKEPKGHSIISPSDSPDKGTKKVPGLVLRPTEGGFGDSALDPGLRNWILEIRRKSDFIAEKFKTQKYQAKIRKLKKSLE